MLGFYGPMGQCFGRFPTVSQRSGGGGRGGERKKGTGYTEIVNPNSHIPHLL